MLVYKLIDFLFFWEWNIQVGHILLQFLRHLKNRGYYNDGSIIFPVIQLTLSYQLKQSLDRRLFYIILNILQHQELFLEIRFNSILLLQEKIQCILVSQTLTFLSLEVGSTSCWIPFKHLAIANNLLYDFIYTDKIIIVDIDNRCIYIYHLLKIRYNLLVHRSVFNNQTNDQR